MKTNTPIIVACSGGVDSMVLAHVLLQNGFNIRLAHCNFQLRALASEQDEKFVRNFAAEHCIPIQTIRFETKQYAEKNKVNIQIAARELRYNWFNSLALEHNAVVALAHHQDDQIETFYIQLLRGGGIRGLCAMEKRNGIFIRPLLNKTKEWINNYAHFHNIKWREDSSNRSNKYQRNEFRNSLLETNKEIGIQGLYLVQQFKAIQRIVQSLSKEIITCWFKNTVLENWDIFPSLLKKEIAYQLKIPRNQIDELDKLAQNQVGSNLVYSSYLLFKERKGISILQKKQTQKHFTSEVLKEYPTSFKKGVFYVNADKIVGEIQLRPRQVGDHFQPFGMKGKKLVSKYLTDKKVLACHKSTAHVLADEEKIIAVEFGTIDEMLKIDKKTRCILALQFC